MVVLIASESASLARIASKQLAGFAINVLSKPPQARDLPGDAACVVFMIGDSRGVWFDALKRIRTESSALPTVVVTNENAETVRVLNKLGVRDVLWFSEISRLADHVADISTRWKLEGLIQKNLQSDLPPSVKAIVMAVVRAEPPFRSVAGLATAMGYDRRTLWKHWSANQRSSLYLKEFLDLVEVCRAFAFKEVTHGSWNSIASALKVRPEKLRRARRRIGITCANGDQSTHAIQLLLQRLGCGPSK